MQYVLITPAHNEAAFIEKTLDSMVAQTILPKRWVIVDDGSTDRTAEIVQDYANNFSGSNWSGARNVRIAISPVKLTRLMLDSKGFDPLSLK